MKGYRHYFVSIKTVTDGIIYRVCYYKGTLFEIRKEFLDKGAAVKFAARLNDRQQRGA